MKKRIFSLLLTLCLVVGMLPTVAYAYNNYDTIDSGEFNEEVTNSGIIDGGTFNNTVTNIPGSYINNGTFNGIVYNRGGCQIADGIFNNTVNNDSASDHILGGTFNATVNNNSGAKIQGGTFNGTVNNTGTAKIQNGTFYSTVNNNFDCDIRSGTFYGDVENNGNITGGTFYGTIIGSGTLSGATYRRIVTFDSNGGSEVSSQDILKDSTATEPTDPTKEDYTFEGWYNGDTLYDFDTPVTENIILTAKWTVDRIKLTKAILESSYKSSNRYSLPDGHYYLGENISVDKNIDIGDRSTVNNVILDLNGYELRKDDNTVLLYLQYDSTLTVIDSSVTKSGKIVSDYAICFTSRSKLNANGGTIEGDVHLSGKNAIIDNTDPSNVTVFRNGQIGGTYSTAIINDGIFYSTVNNYHGTITGGTFYGEVTNINLTTGGTFYGEVTNNGTITGGTFYGTIIGSGTLSGATYRRIVTFDSNGGSEVPSQDILKDSTATEPTAPAKENCTFEGWYNGDALYNFNTPVTESITLKAKWSEKSSITFNTNPQSCTYNGSTQAFSITETSITDFNISYKQNGQIVTNPTNAGSYDVIITRAEDNTYNAVDVTISNGLVIEPAAPAENPAKKTTARVVRGRTLADAAVTNGEILALDGVTPLTGTFAWVDSTKAMSADGTEQMVFTPDNANYAPITINVAVSTYTTGGGSATPTYPPTVTQPDNGSVTVSPKSPKKGDTVTITPRPEAGYTVEQILVTDKNGDPVKVTNNGDGTYSFTQPAGKVDVEVTFMEDNTMLNFFVDVPANEYYYDAVLWAAENGITGGVDDVHFAPNAPCTRAQIVTFLWRAAGSPEPKNLSSLSDVSADAYYAKAVAWALENGITTGTGDGTTFSPNATCTRAQAMAFIYRSEQARGGGMQGTWMFLNPFSDVDLESYYGEAVMWAVANGVTDGTTATTFSPNATCTRAQIVTFLFRCLGGE